MSDKFVEILAAALEKNNQEGFDYFEFRQALKNLCLLYTSDAADERSSVDLGGRRIIKKKKKIEQDED